MFQFFFHFPATLITCIVSIYFFRETIRSVLCDATPRFFREGQGAYYATQPRGSFERVKERTMRRNPEVFSRGSGAHYATQPRGSFERVRSDNCDGFARFFRANEEKLLRSSSFLMPFFFIRSREHLSLPLSPLNRVFVKNVPFILSNVQTCQRANV